MVFQNILNKPTKRSIHVSILRVIQAKSITKSGSIWYVNVHQRGTIYYRRYVKGLPFLSDGIFIGRKILTTRIWGNASRGSQ